MKRLFIFFLVLISHRNYAENKLLYLQPLQDAKYVNINDNIIIGFKNPVKINKPEIQKCIEVIGTKSGFHYSELFLSGNNRIILKPLTPFVYNEEISVRISGVLSGEIGKKPFEYRFTTSKRKVNHDLRKNGPEFAGSTDQMLLPPLLNVTVNNDPSPGYFFMAPYSSSSDLIIANNNGTTYWFRNFPFNTGDFKVQPNGLLTYFSANENAHFGMNSNFEVTHQFYCGNGYITDIHELKVLSNGHALLMAYDPQTVDMREFLSGGDSDATVTGLIIQETDENNNVIFQWRSWDHFEITDATHENLLDSVIDYVHGNAIDVDNDNNLLISSRNMDEITKINRLTGSIIWRLGGKNNQFTFINDTAGFSHQHDIRRINNGNITLYDNGNFHSPNYSRAVEYLLDEINMTATLVWQYRNTPDVYASWGGNVQRLPDGNTLIFWGGSAKTMTEVKPNGTKTFEASYPFGAYTYRGYKFDWSPPVGISSQNNEIPGSFRLYQNYPNPFNPYTIIEFDISKATETILSIYDITGKEIRREVNQFLQPGNYRIRFNSENLPSGLYLCKLSTVDFTEVKKMMLVK